MWVVGHVHSRCSVEGLGGKFVGLGVTETGLTYPTSTNKDAQERLLGCYFSRLWFAQALGNKYSHALRQFRSFFT